MPSDPPAKGARHLRVGKYQVNAHIATGGMGAVYRATDLDTGHDVALKVLSPEIAAKPGVVERFRREAAHAAKLRHENIVRLYDWGEVNNIYYLAFEYFDGTDLQAYITRKGMLRPEVARQIMIQAARALGHVHQQNIVHRDIKPSNFLLRKRNGQPFVKLIDLGLAREIDNEEFRITRANHTLGTIDYMSPEQARDSGLADARSDIYSLGCTFYHLLAGHPPFPEGGLAERLHKHTHVDPPDVSDFNADVPPGMVQIVRRMTAKDPALRYQGVDELLEDLTNPENVRSPIKTEFLAELAREENGSPAMRSTPVREGRKSDPSAKHAPKPPSDPAFRERPASRKSDPSARTIRPSPSRSSFSLDDDSDDDSTDGGTPGSTMAAAVFAYWWIWAAAAGVVLFAVILALWLGRAGHRPSPVGAAAADLKPTQPEPREPTRQTGVTLQQEGLLAKASTQSAAALVRPTPPLDSPLVFQPAGTRQGLPLLYQPAAQPDTAALRRELELPWASDSVGENGLLLVVRRGGVEGKEFFSLGAACAAAPTGATVEVADNGPLFVSPFALAGRQVRVRAAKGFRPLLAFDIGQAVSAHADAWISIAEGGIILEGLDVVLKVNDSPGPSALFSVRDSSFRARDCTMSVAGRSRGGTALVRLEGNRGRCRFDRCYARGSDLVALDLRAPSADVLLDGCLVVGGDRPLVDVAGHNSGSAVVRVVRSTLSATATAVRIRPATRMDLAPAFRWLGWDDLIARPGSTPGGALFSLVDGAREIRIQWQAINCLYCGWQALLGATGNGTSDLLTWQGLWHRSEGDIARSETWPTLGHLEVGELPAREFQTSGSPVYFAATSGGALGCDVAALPSTRDSWLAVTFDRAIPPALDSGTAGSLPAIPAESGRPYVGERLDLGRVLDLGAYLRHMQRTRGLAPLIVLHLVGTGDYRSSPIQMRGSSLTLAFEPREGRGGPPTLTPNPSAVSTTGLAFVDIENGDLSLVNARIRLPDSTTKASITHALRVRNGNLTVSGCRLIGPATQTPSSYRGLIRFEPNGTPDAPRTCLLNTCVLVSGGYCLKAGGRDALVQVLNCLMVSRDDALCLDAGGGTVPRVNLQVWLAHNTLAVGRGVLRLQGSGGGSAIPDPVVVQSEANAFLAPFADAVGRAGLLRYEGDALDRGLLVWQGDGDAYDQRLAFARLAAEATGVSPQPHTTWTAMWGSTGDHRPILDLNFSRTIDAASLTDPGLSQFERLTLPGRRRTRPEAGADFAQLELLRTRSRSRNP